MVAGSFVEHIIVPEEDLETKFVQVRDLFWKIPDLRPQLSVNPENIDNGIVKKISRSVFKKGPSKEAKQFCNDINAFIGMFNSMLQVQCVVLIVLIATVQ